jgi:hypothetical protein
MLPRRPATVMATLAVVIGFCAAGLLAPAPAHAAAYRIPPSIPGDCSVDVTEPIQSWIASVPDGSVLVFGDGACYRIDGTLELTDRHALQLEGDGATFRAMTQGGAWRSQWRLVGGSQLVFHDMNVRGANPAGGTFASDLQHQHAWELVGVDGVEIGHVNASDLYGDCVYVGQGWDSARSWSSNVHVHDSTCTRNGRMGVAVVAGRHVRVDTTAFRDIALTVFDIEPNGPGFGAQDITFTGNRVSGALRGGFFTEVGEGPVDSVVVTDNRASGVGLSMAVLAPRGERRSNVTVAGNASDTGYYAAGDAALDFERVDGLTVTGNTIPVAGPNMTLASVLASCDVTVVANAFPGGVDEARIAPYPCPSRRGASAPGNGAPGAGKVNATRLARTSTTLRVLASTRRGGGPGPRVARGRVRGPRSGWIAIRLERFDRTTRRWVASHARRLRLGRDGTFGTRLGALSRGRWRAKATFAGDRSRASSASSLRYFRIEPDRR